jgi:hypothetical protein
MGPGSGGSVATGNDVELRAFGPVAVSQDDPIPARIRRILSTLLVLHAPQVALPAAATKPGAGTPAATARVGL